MPYLFAAAGALVLSLGQGFLSNIGDRFLPQSKGVSVPTILLVVGSTLAAVYAARRFLK